MKKINKERLTIAWASLLIGCFLSISIFRNLSVLFFVLVFMIAIGIYVLVNVVAEALAANNVKSSLNLMAYMEEIRNLSIEKATEEAEKILKEKGKFFCVETEEIPPDVIFRMGSISSGFFKKYKKVKVLYGDTIFGWELMRVSDYDQNYIRIGLDTDFIEYAVKSHEDEIYELGEGIDTPCSIVPTIYHLFLLLDQSIYDGRPLPN